MSRIYLIKHRPLLPRFLDRADLMDRISELELQNALLTDKIDACMGFLEGKNKQISELKTQLKRAEKRIERLRFELAVADRSLDIVTEKKGEADGKINY